MLPSGELVYFVATFVVVYDRLQERQRHYIEHNEEVTWYDVPTYRRSITCCRSSVCSPVCHVGKSFKIRIVLVSCCKSAFVAVTAWRYIRVAVNLLLLLDSWLDSGLMLRHVLIIVIIISIIIIIIIIIIIELTPSTISHVL